MKLLERLLSTSEEDEETKSKKVFAGSRQHLAISSRLLVKILDTLPAPCLFLDPTAKILCANKAALNLLQTSSKNMVGKTCCSLFPENEHPDMDCPCLEAVESKSMVFRKKHLYLEDRYYASLCIPLFDAKKEIISVLEIACDVADDQESRDEIDDTVVFIQQLIDTIPNPVYYKDRCHRYLGCNTAFADLFQLDRKQIIGKTLEDLNGFSAWRLSPMHTEKEKELFKTKNKIVYEDTATAPDGTTRNLIFTKAVIEDSEGKLAGLIGIITDVTEQKLTEGNLRTKSLAIEAAMSAIVTTDLEARITYANQAFLDMHGYTSLETVVGRHASEFVTDPETPGRIMKALIESEEHTFSGEIFGKRADGSVFPILFNASVVFDENGEPVELVGIFQDLSELEETQDQLNRTLNGLIRAMGIIVEQRDRYTAGHQERVALLADAIANQMGLSEKRKRTLYVAAMLHDIGKMSVPSEILNKPGKLPYIEIDLIRRHAAAGEEILSEIPFDGPVAKIVGQHHERLDGSGYPRRLKNDEILFEAKILAVADVVEAMSSYRAYRPAVSIAEALSEIIENKGRLYDPEVVDACLRVFDKGFEFPYR